MPEPETGDEIAKCINSLNSEQTKVFNVVYTWTKEYAKYDANDVQPAHISLSGSEGTSKSHLVNVIYKAISKTFRCSAQ